MSDVRPALVDLVLTKCDPGVAAYHATILHLAARSFPRGQQRAGRAAGDPARAAARR